MRRTMLRLDRAKSNFAPVSHALRHLRDGGFANHSICGGELA